MMRELWAGRLTASRTSTKNARNQNVSKNAEEGGEHTSNNTVLWTRGIRRGGLTPACGSAHARNVGKEKSTAKPFVLPRGFRWEIV